eukprot:COSAG03_NODE_4420_length_1558_cov_1.750514_2_plen_402_part_01
MIANPGTAQEAAVLTDFGMCLDLTKNRIADFRVPMPYDGIRRGGAPIALAPEVTLPRPGPDVFLDYSRNDEWAVGMIAHELLSQEGAVPFADMEHPATYSDAAYQEETIPQLCRPLVSGLLRVAVADRLDATAGSRRAKRLEAILRQDAEQRAEEASRARVVAEEEAASLALARRLQEEEDAAAQALQSAQGDRRSAVEYGAPVSAPAAAQALHAADDIVFTISGLPNHDGNMKTWTLNGGWCRSDEMANGRPVFRRDVGDRRAFMWFDVTDEWKISHFVAGGATFTPGEYIGWSFTCCGSGDGMLPPTDGWKPVLGKFGTPKLSVTPAVVGEQRPRGEPMSSAASSSVTVSSEEELLAPVSAPAAARALHAGDIVFTISGLPNHGGGIQTWTLNGGWCRSD